MEKTISINLPENFQYKKVISDKEARIEALKIAQSCLKTGGDEVDLVRKAKRLMDFITSGV